MSEPLLIERGPLLNFSGGGFWAIHPHRLELFWYATVEHRFQAMKTLFLAEQPRQSPSWEHDQIAMAINARTAKERGRFIVINVEPWDHFAPRAMLEALVLKFLQNTDTFLMLRETGDRPLVEHRADPTWGDNLDGTGKNLMGLALMYVRERLCR